VKEPSVDRIVLGKPDTRVTGIGTAWMPYFRTCREAVARGINLLVVHEPAFYTHWDLDARKGDDFLSAPATGRAAYIEARDRKRAWLVEKGLVILRCHDVWDLMAGVGIPHAFGRLLGFADADRIRSKTYMNVYSVEAGPALAQARRIAARLAAVGQPGVAFYGDPERKVASVGVGTGCICDPLEMMELAPDLFVAIDDTVRTWIHTTWAEDTGRPLVVVNHGASEEAGVRTLSEHLKATYPAVEVTHIPQGCTYRFVTASA
jgi:putative NIF3 family GTP cyclohydrolase 1 type 2